MIVIVTTNQTNNPFDQVVVNKRIQYDIKNNIIKTTKTKTITNNRI